jgi:hypothetical protein
MNPADNLEHSIRQFQVTTGIETDRRILNDAFAALEGAMPGASAGVGRAMRQIVVFPSVVKLAAAAAVVVVACTLLFKALSPKTVELGQVYQALQKAENVCVSRYTDAEAEPIQQVLTSRTLKIVMYKSQRGTQAQFDLFDIPNRLKKTRYQASDTVSTERLTAEAVIRAEGAIRDVFELVPFADMGSAPKGSQWGRVPKKYQGASVSGTQAYELTWLAEGLFYKYRIFADAKSDLPKRIEYYFKEKSQDQYKFESRQVASYPTEKEIKLLIKEIFGPDQDRSGEPGYIGTPEHHGQGTSENPP